MYRLIKMAGLVALIGLIVFTDNKSNAAPLFPQMSQFKKDSSEKVRKLNEFMTALYQRRQFTGAVLVAYHGGIIYEKAFGMANRERNDPYTLNTPEYIGSISKQITAMGIMMLKERGKLTYQQSVRQFFPELPEFMQPVTLLDLLRHTSGLATFDDAPDMTEADVFNILLKQTSLHFKPGERFEYCNAGYTLLGMIVEEISGQSLNKFLTENIFVPLGMKHTSVNEITSPNKERAIGYDQFGTQNNYDSFMGGCASVISTVGDLYKWDQSMSTTRLVSRRTLKDAFTPSPIHHHSDTYGNRSYGFGWWISDHNGSRDLAHNGAFGGFRAYNEIISGQQITIIHISNLRHDVMDEIRNGIINILEDKPCSLPKISIAAWVYAQTRLQGIDSAISLYNHIKTSPEQANYNFSEPELNSLGYYLLRSSHIPEAIKIFTLNTQVYPKSSNVYDSLGEAYLKSGNKPLGLENYQKALALDPGNTDLKKRIDAIR